jgi:ankyrin repeat protein
MSSLALGVSVAVCKEKDVATTSTGTAESEFVRVRPPFSDSKTLAEWMTAAAKNDVNKLKTLLATKRVHNVNVSHKYGWTALHVAAYHANVELVTR